MTNVYAWPPVGLTGWELHPQHGVSRSTGFFGDSAYTSSRGRFRRMVTAVATGLGVDMNAAGYIENLKYLLAGGEHLVRIEAQAPLWFFLDLDPNLRNALMNWTEGETEMVWTDGGTEVLFSEGRYPLAATPAMDGVWPALQVSGFPPNTVVAHPSQRVTVTTDSASEASRVLTAAVSDGSGEALIRTFDTFTLTGLASFGDTESMVLEATDIPRAVQPIGGDWSYTWNFREVFADEYESWTELNPWQ